MKSTMDSFHEALRARMLHDMATQTTRESSSARLANSNKRVQAQLRALAAGIPEGVPLSPLQTRMRDIITATDAHFAGLLEALGIAPDDEDPRQAAAVALLAPLVGQMMALEARIVALEKAV